MAAPVTVLVGGLATADADGLCVAQAAAAAQYLAINGALADEDADNICASQSPGGAGNLTIDGALAVSGIAYIPTRRRIYITSAGNDSGRTFTIYGLVRSPQGNYASVVETVTGANTSVVSSTNAYDAITRIAISGASAAAVTVGMNGLGTLDVARRVLITSAGNDTSITYTLYGTNWAGDLISEVITGPNATTATSVLSYKTVTGVLTSAATASTVEIGTNGVADSPWVRFEDFAANSQTTIQTLVAGTVNYDIETAMLDPNAQGTYAYQAPGLVSWLDALDTELVNETASKSGFFAYTPIWARVTLNSGTGTVRATFRQAYLG